MEYGHRLYVKILMLLLVSIFIFSYYGVALNGTHSFTELSDKLMVEPTEISYFSWDGGSNEHVYKSIYFNKEVILLGDSGNEDIMAIFAFSENGTSLWHKYIKLVDRLSRLITVANDSKYLVAGGFYYNDTRGEYDGFLVKFDVNGNIMWRVIGNYSGSIEFRNVMYDANTNYYVVSGIMNEDSYVWLFNQSGKIVASKDVAPSSYGWDRINAAIVYNESTYAFLGYGDAPNGLKQSFIIFTNRELTNERIIYINNSNVNEYSLDLLAAQHYLYVDISENYAHSRIYKLDVNGNIVWSRIFPEHVKYVFKKMEMYDGAVFAVGYQKYINGSANVTMIYLTSEGDDIWNYSARISGKDYIYDISWVSNYVFYLWGNTTNANDDVFGIKYTVDESKPKISIISPANNTYINHTELSVEWRGYSDGGIDHYEVSDGGNTWVNVNMATNYSFTSLLPGAHEIYVKVVALNGMINESKVRITVDLMPPSLTIIKPNLNGYYNTTSIFVSWNATDNYGISKTLIQVDNQTPINVTGFEKYYVNLTEGIHILTILVEDLAGNAVKKSTAFDIDTTPPSLNVDAIGRYVNYSKISISWYAKDNTGIADYAVKIDNKSWVTTMANTTNISLKDGFHNISVLARDKAGNVAEKTMEICVDTHAPILTDVVVNRNGDGWHLSWAVRDNTSGVAYVKVYVDGKFVAQVTKGKSIVIKDLSPGKHRIRIDAYDYAGNMNAKTLVFTEPQSVPWVLIFIVLLGVVASAFLILFLLRRRNKRLKS